MLYRRGVFGDERYLERKERALKLQSKGHKFVTSKRDLIPSCIVDRIRKWFPNPQELPYIGHKWEWEGQ